METIPKIVHVTWHEYLEPLFNDDRMKYIKYRILPTCKFLPKGEDIFRVFAIPFNEIRVVVLGQDPYPTPGNANGLAFAVNDGVEYPPSLKIIRQEVVHSVYWSAVRSGEWGTLEHWEKQGIFLLNTALTVEEYNPGRHLKVWRWFTEEVIKLISMNIAPIWLLWGKKAQSFEPLIVSSEIFLTNDILKAPHPAAELHTANAGFLGCNHFKRVNTLLTIDKKTIINF